MSSSTGSEGASAQPPVRSAQRLSLPSADDSDWDSAWGSDLNRLVRLRDYLTAGRTVWWRRGEIHRGPFGGVELKWHIFFSRTRNDPNKRWDFTWHALCEFQNSRTEIISGLNDFKVTAPRVDTRCKSCVSTLEAIKTAASASSASKKETP